jgi:hypothetical protein
VNRTEVKLDGIWGGSASYPGKPSCADIDVAKGIIKPNRTGEPEAGRAQRVADSRVVLMTQGR